MHEDAALLAAGARGRGRGVELVLVRFCTGAAVRSGGFGCEAAVGRIFWPRFD
jgi:hypothetical protein